MSLRINNEMQRLVASQNAFDVQLLGSSESGETVLRFLYKFMLPPQVVRKGRVYFLLTALSGKNTHLSKLSEDLLKYIVSFLSLEHFILASIRTELPNDFPISPPRIALADHYDHVTNQALPEEVVNTIDSNVLKESLPREITVAMTVHDICTQFQAEIHAYHYTKYDFYYSLFRHPVILQLLVEIEEDMKWMEGTIFHTLKVPKTNPVQSTESGQGETLTKPFYPVATRILSLQGIPTYEHHADEIRKFVEHYFPDRDLSRVTHTHQQIAYTFNETTKQCIDSSGNVLDYFPAGTAELQHGPRMYFSPVQSLPFYFDMHVYTLFVCQ